MWLTWKCFVEGVLGDQLRMVYDQLSRDPASLSNLDQDLPNYAQPQIPIFSLPQDWLWCESWCSDASKETAKTIDLCNHPATKENKLTMAKRIINRSALRSPGSSSTRRSRRPNWGVGKFMKSS